MKLREMGGYIAEHRVDIGISALSLLLILITQDVMCSIGPSGEGLTHYRDLIETWSKPVIDYLVSYGRDVGFVGLAVTGSNIAFPEDNGRGDRGIRHFAAASIMLAGFGDEMAQFAGTIERVADMGDAFVFSVPAIAKIYQGIRTLRR